MSTEDPIARALLADLSHRVVVPADEESVKAARRAGRAAGRALGRRIQTVASAPQDGHVVVTTVLVDLTDDEQARLRVAMRAAVEWL